MDTSTPDSHTGRMASRGPVLLIEHDPRHAIGLVRTLSAVARVRLAGGLQDALAIAATEAPELLLVSDMLPHAGYEALLRACREDAALANTPVMVLLCAAEERAEIAALRAGAVACVPRLASPELMASRVRATLDLLRSTAYWRESAQSDALTGLASRRQLDAVLHREWRRAQRVQQPLALLMVDLDHFKAYNDHHGHLAGDQCLRAVAHVLAQATRRATDVAGRFGGEEFAVLLSETDGRGGRAVAKLLMTAVNQRALPHGGKGAGPCVTVSIGVSAWEPGRGDPGVMALVAAADAALYDAKRQGRNGAAWRMPPRPLQPASPTHLSTPPSCVTGTMSPMAWAH